VLYHRCHAFSDPLYASQWHLHNSAGVDLSVVPAWEAGYSGRGVGTHKRPRSQKVVTAPAVVVVVVVRSRTVTLTRNAPGHGLAGVSIVDDGLEWRHGDLGEARYMRAASHDWNGKDDDPSPASYDDTHGTCTRSIRFILFDINLSYFSNLGLLLLLCLTIMIWAPSVRRTGVRGNERR
jgi:hypothetical protein